MPFQPAAENPFETPPSSPTSVHDHDTSIVHDPHIILSYNDPTCNNISLYTFDSNNLNDEEIRPRFIGVSSSDNPYFSTCTNDDDYDKVNELPRVAKTTKLSAYFPSLKSILSCNGLLGLVTHRHLQHGSARTEFQVRIINPVTSESLELLPAKPDRFRPWVGFGLGFDPMTNENFVIRLSHSHSFNKRQNIHKKNNHNPHPECLPYHVSGSSVNVVEVLSLEHVDRGWKSVLVNCHSVPWAHTLKPVGLGGAVHWMIHDHPKPEEYDYYDADSDDEGGVYRQGAKKHIDYSSLLIAKFDLKKSKLTTFPGPPITGGAGGYDPNGWGPKLMEHNGCLTLVVNMGYSTDIWMMKQHGVKESSWTKHVSMSMNNYSSKQAHVLCMLGDDHVLMLRSAQLLELYDPKTRTYKMFRLSTVARLAHIAVLNPCLSSLCVT